jgi:hypothetical protein
MHRPFLAFCTVLLVGPAWAQFTDLTAPGHGADLYYALQIPQPIPDAYSTYTSSASAGPVYRVGSVPPTLFASSSAPVFPPNGIYATNTIWFLSAYYLVSHPQFSRDGSVFAFMGKRVCMGGLGCTTVATTQTTVQGVPGQGTLTFGGKGWLSGNGRFLLLQPEPSVAIAQQPVWVDLQTGQRQALPNNVAASPDSNGRVLADDGTVVLPCCIFRGGQLVPLQYNVSQPVIDAAAQTVVYTSTTADGSGPRYLRVYNIAAKQDTVFVQPNGDTYSPAISAVGMQTRYRCPRSAHKTLRNTSLLRLAAPAPILLHRVHIVQVNAAPAKTGQVVACVAALFQFLDAGGPSFHIVQKLRHIEWL